MATPDVIVSFGGSTADLNAQMAAAQRSVDDASENMRRSSESAAPAFEALSEKIDRLAESTERAARASEGLKSYVDLSLALNVVAFGYKAATTSVGLYYSGMKLGAEGAVKLVELNFQLMQSITGLVPQFLAYARSQAYLAEYAPLVQVRQEGLIASIGRLSQSYNTMLSQQQILYGGLTGTATATLAAAGGFEKMSDAASRSRFGDIGTMLSSLAAKLADGRIPDMTQEVASSLVTMFAAVPNGGVMLTHELTNIVAEMGNTKEGAEKLGSQLAQLMTDPASGGLAFLKSQQDITAEQIAQFDLAQRQNDLNGMRASILEVYLQKEKDLVARQTYSTDAVRKENEERIRQGGIMATIGQISNRLHESAYAQDQKQKEASQQQLQNHQAVIEKLRTMSVSTEQVARDAADLVRAFDPLTSKLDKVNAQIKTLEDSMKNAASGASSGSEGGGAIGKYWTPEIMKHTMDRLMNEAGLSHMGAAALVGRWSSVEAAGGPGSRNPDSGAWGIGQWLGDRKIGIDGNADLDAQISHAINELLHKEFAAADALRSAQTPAQARRGASMYERAEGYAERGDGTDNFTDKTPVERVLALTKEREVMDQVLVQRQQYNDQLQGGNAVARAQAEIADRAAKGQKDSVRDAEQMVAAWRSLNTYSKTEEMQKQRGLSEALVAAARARLELEKSEIELKDRPDKSKEEDDNLAKAREKFAIAMRLAQQDKAQQNAAREELQAAELAYETAKTAREKSAEESSYQILLTGLQAKQRLLKEEVAGRNITNAEKLKLDTDLQDQINALTIAHLTKMRGLETEGTLAYQQADERLTQATQSGILKRQQIISADARKIQQEYQSVFRQIGSGLESSIMGMIQGTTTLRQAMQKVALDVLQIWVHMGVQQVADWGARQAQLLMQTVTGQAGQTAAVAAGESARVAAKTSGAAAGAAVEKASTMATISSDAGKAGAGAYAAVTQIPIIGPILAPAAAATAYAATLAFGSFDTGSWSIPSDQLAMVHAGEMIVPSRGGVAEEFRSFLDGSSPSGGENHFHFNVSAMDGSSVKSAFMNNQSALAAAISAAVRNGHTMKHSNLRRL